MGGLSSLFESVGDFVSDNAGAIVGGIVGYYTLGLGTPLGASWGTAIGSSVGDYAQHGDTRRALMAGAAGYGVGGMAGANAAASVPGSAAPAANPMGAVAHSNPVMSAPAQAMGAPGSSAAIDSYIGNPNAPSGGIGSLSANPSNVAHRLPGPNAGATSAPVTASTQGISSLPTSNIGSTPDQMNMAMGHGGSGPVITENGMSAAMGNPGPAEPSWLSKTGTFIKDNPGSALLGASMIMGGQEEPDYPDQAPRRDSYDAQMDAYKACVASGRTDCELPEAYKRDNLTFGKPRVTQPVNTGIGSLGRRDHINGLLNELSPQGV